MCRTSSCQDTQWSFRGNEKMQETKKFRGNLGTFDLVKGIAMMVVVMGHVIGYYDISKMPVMTPVFMLMAFAASGLMPLFFMISGFGFK